MCEVLRALVKCGGLSLCVPTLYRPLAWEVPRFGTANIKVWYFFVSHLSISCTTLWYGKY